MKGIRKEASLLLFYYGIKGKNISLLPCLWLIFFLPNI